MATIDLTTPEGKIRAAIGDWVDPIILDDDTILQVYANCNSNEPQAIKTCAYYILATLTQSTHSRVDRLETYGNQAFDQYLSYIKQVITNPASGLAGLSLAGVYAGGVDVAEFNTNAADSTTKQKQIPSYDNYRDPDYDSLI